jgi:hypothetical protein
MLANFSNDELILPKATILGVAEEVSESLVDRINAKTKLTRPNRANHPEREKIRLCTIKSYKANWII